MSEEPTAKPEPVPWGTKDYPFPEGTLIKLPDGWRVKVKACGHPRMVDVGGFPHLPKEIQGRINEAGWKVVGRRSEQ